MACLGELLSIPKLNIDQNFRPLRPIYAGKVLLSDGDVMLAHLKRASIFSRIALGERSGLKARRIGSSFGYEEEIPKLRGARKAAQGKVNFTKLTRETETAARVEAVTRFQTEPECKVFLSSLRAGSVGITLTEAGDGAFFEFDWNENGQKARKRETLTCPQPDRD